MTVRIDPYKAGSASSRALCEQLGIKRIRKHRSVYVPREGDTIINWGNSRMRAYPDGVRILNKPEAVTLCADKLRFFSKMSDGTIPLKLVPNWATSMAEAETLRFPVVCRRVLNGHSGQGIHIAETRDDLVEAPLYVEYMKKMAEYRIHFVNDEVIDIQRKVRDPDQTPTDWRVRSHRNGFIFIRETTPPSPQTMTAAQEAFRHSGLDFGAVDAIEQRNGGGAILEINTAPGLTGTTLTKYVEAFRKIL